MNLTPDSLFNLLITAANAKTWEEQARVAWRCNDLMWAEPEVFGLPFCRRFNDLLQDKNWPWVDNLWADDEMHIMQASWERQHGIR
jgi:hypothetical protein